jgi:hypothetical protein
MLVRLALSGLAWVAARKQVSPRATGLLEDPRDRLGRRGERVRGPGARRVDVGKPEPIEPRTFARHACEFDERVDWADRGLPCGVESVVRAVDGHVRVDRGAVLRVLEQRFGHGVAGAERNQRRRRVGATGHRDRNETREEARQRAPIVIE